MTLDLKAIKERAEKAAQMQAVAATGTLAILVATDIPALITEVERLEAENARLREALGWIEDYCRKVLVLNDKSVYAEHVRVLQGKAALSAQEDK